MEEFKKVVPDYGEIAVQMGLGHQLSDILYQNGGATCTANLVIEPEAWVEPTYWETAHFSPDGSFSGMTGHQDEQFGIAMKLEQSRIIGPRILKGLQAINEGLFCSEGNDVYCSMTQGGLRVIVTLPLSSQQVQKIDDEMLFEALVSKLTEEA